MTKQKTNLKARKCIQSKSLNPKDVKQVYLDIQEAILDGYRIAENWDMKDLCTPRFMGHIHQVVLYKEGQEFEEEIEVVEKASEEETAKVESSEESDSIDKEGQLEKTVEIDLDHVTSIPKKADLLTYLESVGVNPPEDLKTPNAIKKWVRENT